MCFSRDFTCIRFVKQFQWYGIKISHSHTGSIQYSLTRKLVLLLAEIYKIFLKTGFQEDRLTRSIVINLSSIEVSLLPNLLFNVMWKVNTLIMSLFSPFSYMCYSFLILLKTSSDFFLLFVKALYDFVVPAYRVWWWTAFFRA